MTHQLALASSLETIGIIRSLKGTLPPDVVAKERELEERRDEIQTEARSFEGRRKSLLEKMAAFEGAVPAFSLAVALFQIALMVMPIAMLRSSKHFLGAGIVFGAIAFTSLLSGFFSYF
ncbi:MAG: DUF4337 family protein [Bdellovibrionia bacterium]